MSLRDDLSQISFIEVIDYIPKAKSEVCLIRVEADQEETWFHMFGRVLLAQQQQRANAVSVSKQYVMKGTSLTYIWKIVVTDRKWFMGELPRIDKVAEAQKNYHQVVRPDGSGSAPLLGLPENFSPTPLPEDVLKKR